MLVKVSRLSPRFKKRADCTELGCPAMTLKVIVLGAIASNGSNECPVPCSPTATLDENPGCKFVTLMTASLDKGPTDMGVHVTSNVNICPDVRLNGTMGRFERTKFASPSSPTASTLVPVSALHVTVNGADTLLSETEPKEYGDEQFSGELTGEPNP